MQLLVQDAVSRELLHEDWRERIVLLNLSHRPPDSERKNGTGDVLDLMACGIRCSRCHSLLRPASDQRRGERKGSARAEMIQSSIEIKAHLTAGQMEEWSRK